MMSAQTKKKIEDLEKQKRRAENKGNLAEVARLCNSGGELLSSAGLYEEAVKWHEEELRYSIDADDGIGVAIAHRKVGECFCELGRYEKALDHQYKHLELTFRNILEDLLDHYGTRKQSKRNYIWQSKAYKSLVEEQRAWATIGRTRFVQSGSCDETSEKERCLLKSQEAYLKSLSVCDKLGDLIIEKEIMEMRARLYLNLGLVYEWRNDLDKAERFMKDALTVSRERKLHDNIYRCYIALSGVTSKNKKFTDALDYAKGAQSIAKEKGKKVMEADALAQIGQILLKVGELSAAIRMFRKSYRLSPPATDDEKEVLTHAFKLAVKGKKLEQNLENRLGPSEEKLKICEKLGDLYSDAKSPLKALEYYKKQLEVAEELEKDRRTLAAIYVSLAVTYSENGEPDEAVECYVNEMEIRQGDLKEQCSSWCAIAKLQEDSGKGIKIVKATYMKALECAKKANKRHHQIKVYNDLANSCGKAGREKEAEKFHAKARSLIDEYGDVASDDEDDSQEPTADKDGETEEDVLQLLLAPDSSDGEEEKDNEASINSIKKSVTRRYSKRKVCSRLRSASQREEMKVDKPNRRGETPLHVACIKGNTAKVKELLEKGASVHTRDFCGWQPLHEACNFGHTDIIQLLLDHGANINDAGGEHCEGITPLHDAAQNGHLQAVQMLATRGADLNVTDEKGNTPLHLVQAAIKAEEHELYGSESDTLHNRRNVYQFLENALQGQTPTQRESLQQQNLDPFDLDTETIEQNRPSYRNTRRDSVSDKPKNAQNMDPENFITESHTLRSSQTNKTSLTPHALSDSNVIPKEQSNLFTPDSSEEGLDCNGIDPDLFFPDTDMNSHQESTYTSMDEDNMSGLSPPKDSPLVTSANESVSDNGNSFEARKEIISTNLPTSISVSLSSSASGSKEGLLLQPHSHDRYVNLPSCSRVALNTLKDLTDDSNARLRSDSDEPTFVEEQNSDTEEVKPLLLGGFIVDDVGESCKKRKTETSHVDITSIASNIRKAINQSSSLQRNVFKKAFAGQSTTILPTMSCARQQASSVQKPAHKRQTKLTETALWIKKEDRPDVTVKRENCNPFLLAANDDVHILDHITQEAPRPLLRICVRVEDKVFLIPCRDSHEKKTVKWMADEASQRYMNSSATGMYPKISLKTKDGALLDPKDFVSDVLLNNEEVTGTVDSWDAGSVIEKYKTTCETHRIGRYNIKKIGFLPNVEEKQPKRAVREDLVDLFSQSSELTSALWNDRNVTSDDVLTLSRAYAGQMQLKKIDFSGNYIGDEGLKHLSSALPYMPNVSILILSCTGVGVEGLSFLCNILSDGPESNFDRYNSQSSCPLSKLEEFDIGFNCLSDATSCSLALGKLVQNCKSLRILRLENCEIEGGVFDCNRELPKALKGNSVIAVNGDEKVDLETLNFTRKPPGRHSRSTSIRSLKIAHNSLGTVGLRNLLQAIPSPYLTELDISSTVNGSRLSTAPVFDELGALMKEPDCVLSKLTLNGINCGDTLTKDPNIFIRLEQLYLSSSSISRNSALSLARSLPPNLSLLDLSNNSQVNNVCLDCLLKSLSKSRNAMTSLMLSSCSIISPLPESVFHNLRTCSSLILLNMNFNHVDSTDKDKLILVWKTSNKPSRKLLLEG